MNQASEYALSLRSRERTALPLSDPDWDALRPRGLYWLLGRPLLNGVLLVVSLPVVALLVVPIALCVALSAGGVGKVLFIQERVGRRGRRFRLYKFRTMRDTHRDLFSSWSEGDRGRTTRLGSLLRRSHLDELPQILNILRGEMTFIGPRPEMLETHRFALAHIPDFERRLSLRPGITGLAQVTVGYTGHDPDAYRAKFQADEEYRLSVGRIQDVRVLWRTAGSNLRLQGGGDGARGPAQERESDSLADLVLVPPAVERAGLAAVAPAKSRTAVNS